MNFLVCLLCSGLKWCGVVSSPVLAADLTMPCAKFPLAAVCASPGLLCAHVAKPQTQGTTPPSLWFSVVARCMHAVAHTTSRIKKTSALSNLLRAVLAACPDSLYHVLVLLTNAIQVELNGV